MQTRSEPTSPPDRINWTAWISGALLVLLLAAAGWALVGSMFSSSGISKDLEPVMPPGARRNWMAQIAPAAPRAAVDGVIVRAAGSRYDVNSGPYRLSATRGRNGQWTVRLTTTRNDLLTPEQDAAFNARWRVTRDSTFAKSLNITPEQLKQLGDIPGKGGLIVSEDDQQQLRALVEAYVAAPPPRESQGAELTRAVGEIGQRSAESTRQTLLERVEKIRAVLTPEQIEKFIQPR